MIHLLRESEHLLITPKTEKGWKTLEKLCYSAEELFYEKGYNGTSVSEITTKAGISAGSFYIYFESKLSIFRYLLWSYHFDLRNHLKITTASIDNRRDREEAGLKEWFKYVRKNKFIFNIAWEAYFVERDLFDEYFSTFAAAYKNEIIKSQKKGEVNNIDPEVLSYILMGITNFLALNWKEYDKNNGFEHVVEQTMYFLENGMFPTKKGVTE